MKEERSSLAVDLEYGGKTVSVGLVRPIHPTDNLFVQYDEAALGCVLNLLRDGGFETKVARCLPTGLYVRKGEMIAMVAKAHGTQIWKTCDAIDEAIFS